MTKPYYVTVAEGSTYKSEDARANVVKPNPRHRSLAGTQLGSHRTEWILVNIFEIDGVPQRPKLARRTFRADHVSKKPRKVSPDE